MGRPVNSMITDPFPHFIFCEMSSSVRSHVACSTMTVDLFWKSMGDHFGRSIAGRERKSSSRVNYLLQNKQSITLSMVEAA